MKLKLSEVRLFLESEKTIPCYLVSASAAVVFAACSVDVGETTFTTTLFILIMLLMNIKWDYYLEGKGSIARGGRNGCIYCCHHIRCYMWFYY